MGNAPSVALQERMDRNKKNFEELNPTIARLKEIDVEHDKLTDKKRKLDDDIEELKQKRVKLETKLSDLNNRLQNKNEKHEKITMRLQELISEYEKLGEKTKQYENYFNLIGEVFEDLSEYFETHKDMKPDEDILLETVTFEEKDSVLHYNGRLSVLFDGTEDKYFVEMLWDMIDFMATFVLNRTHVVKTLPVDGNNKIGKHEIFLTMNN